MEKKAFLKYLVVSWIPLSSLHIVLLRTLLGGLFLLGLFFLWGGRFTFHRKKKSFGFLELFGSAVFYFVFGRNHAATANYRCCLDDWRRNDFVNLSKRNRLNKHKNPSRSILRDGFFTAIIR